MQLVRVNSKKGRSVFFDENCYIKIWEDIQPEWIIQHVELLNELVPGYVLSFGSNWISFKPVVGTPASEFEHTDLFIKQIYKFCLENINATKPYVHGDWCLSNIIINGNHMTMIDWDNVGTYPEQEYLKKLVDDLKSAFGDKFTRVINNDTTIL
jgi:RIO-like serine/threonine protein kinase